MPTTMKVSQLIDDLGGAAEVARIAGVARTAPYRWIKHNYIGSPILERIKAARPNIDLDYYFKEGEAE